MMLVSLSTSRHRGKTHLARAGALRRSGRGRGSTRARSAGRRASIRERVCRTVRARNRVFPAVSSSGAGRAATTVDILSRWTAYITAARGSLRHSVSIASGIKMHSVSPGRSSCQPHMAYKWKRCPSKRFQQDKLCRRWHQQKSTTRQRMAHTPHCSNTCQLCTSRRKSPESAG